MHTLGSMSRVRGNRIGQRFNTCPVGTGNQVPATIWSNVRGARVFEVEESKRHIATVDFEKTEEDKAQNTVIDISMRLVYQTERILNSQHDRIKEHKNSKDPTPNVCLHSRDVLSHYTGTLTQWLSNSRDETDDCCDHP